MTKLDADILAHIVSASAEPILLIRVDQTDWPVLLANPAFESLGGEAPIDRPFADVIEGLVGRDSALEISEALRRKQESSIPVDMNRRDCLIVMKPVTGSGDDGGRYMIVFFRDRAGGALPGGDDAQQALNRARRRLRDLRREDPLTGLLNERSFREVLAHDWAVASREQGVLALVAFTFDDFDAYVDVFGRHAADSCLRRVAQTVQRCLRRASDVVARVGEHRLVVLSHASDEGNVREFAKHIASAVVELKMHHPRSQRGRFVTVSHCVRATTVARGAPTAQDFLDELLVTDW